MKSKFVQLWSTRNYSTLPLILPFIPTAYPIPAPHPSSLTPTRTLHPSYLKPYSSPPTPYPQNRPGEHVGVTFWQRGVWYLNLENETNFLVVTGNFVTDIIHNVTEVDCVILNSGTLRSDTLHPPGKFKMKVTVLNIAAILLGQKIHWYPNISVREMSSFTRFEIRGDQRSKQ